MLCKIIHPLTKSPDFGFSRINMNRFIYVILLHFLKKTLSY
ncbi:hypothetical protein CSC02_1621 [Enterobacter hormaechei subsp. hoffmannii]|nr:hypothetical protein CSC02_1621 [Enterobacter hormaechei subsp. hoffmannii]